MGDDDGMVDVVQWADMKAQSVGERVRQWRTLRGLSQSELAEKVGTDKSYISKVESATVKDPTIDVLARLADALEIPVRQLADPRYYEGENALPTWEFAIWNDDRFTAQEKESMIHYGRTLLSAKRNSKGKT